MKYKDIIIEHLPDIKNLLLTKIDGLVVNELFSPENKPVIGDWSKDNNLPIPVKGDGIGNRSGVYFITSQDNDVLYIGKATKNNIHERIWDHIRTPKIIEDRWRTYPKSHFDVNDRKEYENLVKKGEVKIGIVEIEPPVAISLVEVYLQTIYQHITGTLPPLCKQIG